MTLLIERPRHRVSPPVDDARHIVLENVSWDYYIRTLRALDGQILKVTYDDGRMEIMAPPIGNFHEYAKKCASRLIETYAVGADIPITGLGEVTTQRKDVKKGLEPDECYW